MNKPEGERRRRKGPLTYLYGLVLLLLTLTGFGQMPIFKRYYIADIPGLGWLAQFYVTHYLHYLGAIFFLAIAGYATIRYLAHAKKGLTLTVSGKTRVSLLASLVVTGLLLVWRNLAGVYLPPGLITFLDVSHLCLVMLMLGVTGVCLLRKRSWTTVNAAAVKQRQSEVCNE
jgi:hypothetical protein